MARKPLKGFDQRVKEARKDPVEFELNGQNITVHQLTSHQARALSAAIRAGDEEEQVRAVFGEDQGQQILDAYYADGIPFEVLAELIEDVLKAFGYKGLGNFSR